MPANPFAEFSALAEPVPTVAELLRECGLSADEACKVLCDAMARKIRLQRRLARVVARQMAEIDRDLRALLPPDHPEYRRRR